MTQRARWKRILDNLESARPVSEYTMNTFEKEVKSIFEKGIILINAFPKQRHRKGGMRLLIHHAQEKLAQLNLPQERKLTRWANQLSLVHTAIAVQDFLLTNKYGPTLSRVLQEYENEAYQQIWKMR